MPSFYAPFESRYSCSVIQWNAPTDFGVEFIACQNGALVVADSEAALVEALTVVVPFPMERAA